MKLQRYFVEISYDGTEFHGWQIQKNAITIQSAINDAFNTYLRINDFNCVGCGRTDTGVHAHQFFLHFDSNAKIDEQKSIEPLNAILPRTISIHKVILVKEALHARFDAVSRTYQYFIHTKKSPFLDKYSLRYSKPLDIELMNQACKVIVEYIDFTSFSKVNTDTKTMNCTINEAYWKRSNEQLIFTITANRFLRNMVRAIVGTMLKIGEGKITIDQFREIIEAKDRSRAGQSVNGKGLFLTQVKYPDL